jgi:hypothetical protein
MGRFHLPTTATDRGEADGSDSERACGVERDVRCHADGTWPSDDPIPARAEAPTDVSGWAIQGRGRRERLPWVGGWAPRAGSVGDMAA